eukprot:13953433-Alexandrium_andersonii.AAC.1
MAPEATNIRQRALWASTCPRNALRPSSTATPKYFCSRSTCSRPSCSARVCQVLRSGGSELFLT